MSAVNNFGDIAKRLRELSGARPAAPATMARDCAACLGQGWVYQHAPSFGTNRSWQIAVCPMCGNPQMRKRPT